MLSVRKGEDYSGDLKIQSQRNRKEMAGIMGKRRNFPSKK